MPRRGVFVIAMCVILFGLAFGLTLGCGGSSSASLSGPSEKQLSKEKQKGP
jgi:hypothetical protein